LREIEKESEKYLGRRVSHQVLSYHFRNHVLKLWAGNRIWLYADAQQVPYRLLYLEGRDAPAVARALVQLPWLHTAYIDVGKAVVSGQPPCASMPHLYRVLGDLDVDVVEFAMEVGVLKWVPIFNLLGQFVKREEAEAGRGVAAR
jgi:3'-phosphoadenosine 5'-phosphosulfate sulfotransferase (PAPS reductase)/FAD synthetase